MTDERKDYEPRFYQYRRGDGNDGNWPRELIEIEQGEDLGAALKALVVNDFIAGSSRRRWIAAHLEIEGEENHPTATIYEGPKGVTAFGAAWMTAELEPLSLADAQHLMIKRSVGPKLLRTYLDKGALRLLGKEPPSPWYWNGERKAQYVATHGSLGISGSSPHIRYADARRYLAELHPSLSYIVPLAPPLTEWKVDGMPSVKWRIYSTAWKAEADKPRCEVVRLSTFADVRLTRSFRGLPSGDNLARVYLNDFSKQGVNPQRLAIAEAVADAINRLPE